MNAETRLNIAAGTVAVGVILVLIAIPVVGWPMYRPWAAEKRGEAELRRADMNRKIEVLEAKARQEAATALAGAEIERAKGVAEANRIIGDSLANNEAYLRYLWIQGLNDGTSEVIYVPTEANLPILEASRPLVQLTE